MLSRLLPKPSQLRLLSHLSSKPQPSPLPTSSTFASIFRPLSTGGGNNNGSDGSGKVSEEVWKLSQETDGLADSLFSDDEDAGGLRGMSESKEPEKWAIGEDGKSGGGGEDVFGGVESGAMKTWGEVSSDLLKPWSLKDVGENKSELLFDLGEGLGLGGGGGDRCVRIGGSLKEEIEKREEEMKKLEIEEEKLTAIVKGPNRAFGDLIAESGITDEMLDSLIALKNYEGIEGLPTLGEIEAIRYEKSTRRSARAEMERQKQEEIAKARVRQVDDKGRSYGTGRRKCSIARVWIQPGEGKFTVNEKQFDVYFPMIDHRAALLRPFSETKTLGLWDIDCTVKGGGVSGQVGAIQLGISRALQSWEPDLRPPLRDAGFLTRDSRVVERKKPGKAKARKSFQWVKR
ncbi:30S ribosomal protein S9, mitochondrial [Linum grandiflorum]